MLPTFGPMFLHRAITRRTIYNKGLCRFWIRSANGLAGYIPKSGSCTELPLKS
jgi:hypothetical protein